MNKVAFGGVVTVLGAILGSGPVVSGQTDGPRDTGPGPGNMGRSQHQSDEGANESQNAVENRAWALKGGPGAPHNILPGPVDVRGFAESMFLRMPKISTDYEIGEGDRLDVTFVGGDVLGGATKALTVSNSGAITLPFIGEVQAAGLTAGELEDSIAQLFENKQLLKEPQVLVHITEYQAHPIFVVGEVDNTGEYMMSQQLTVMEAILMSGGIDPGAGSYAYLHRQTGAGQGEPQPQRALENPTSAEASGVEVIEIDIRPLKLGGVPEPDILLRKGDILVVPKSPDRRFYVLGDVRRPGTIVIPPPAERGLLVSQAIAHAGGPGPTAKLSDGVLIRYMADGSREEKEVDYLAILRGKQADFEIQTNDIIFIPGSNVKALAYEMLGVVPEAVTRGAADRVLPGGAR